MLRRRHGRRVVPAAAPMRKRDGREAPAIYGPSPRESGEREGPTAKRWEGEVRRRGPISPARRSLGRWSRSSLVVQAAAGKGAGGAPKLPRLAGKSISARWVRWRMFVLVSIHDAAPRIGRRGSGTDGRAGSARVCRTRAGEDGKRERDDERAQQRYALRYRAARPSYPAASRSVGLVGFGALGVCVKVGMHDRHSLRRRTFAAT